MKLIEQRRAEKSAESVKERDRENSDNKNGTLLKGGETKKETEDISKERKYEEKQDTRTSAGYPINYRDL